METKVRTETTQDVLREDIEAIETIHRRDIAATKAGDIDALKSLMDEQCVVFPPDCEPIGGRAYLDQVWPSADEESRADILKLEQDWQELIVFGGFAYEQGLVRYEIRGESGKIVRKTQRLARILRRQSNGAWRVYRAFWHAPN